ncbi:MucR family transcriptional regulator [Enterovirga aerilata]|uniref:MucR family transcriptional regulator n=1 Tax=Enterovirga aerilata TaxID=2730920 RepID=A0A849IEA5_9HYPH|nr:MucR family transcriptional regulator [Enterovirga sp. DB1703]NNM72213.1 MucR family transcriptional regulator [Enterovirga sp. DB1703]
MESATDIQPQELVELTSEIVSAYVANNKIPSAELPEVIASVHMALRKLEEKKPPEPEKPTPLIPIKKTITPDYLISLEDGRRYKSLKRHLSGRGLTPQEYREKWGLPKDYPMVAPNYAKQRSELAKALGLGQQRRKKAEEAGSGAAAPEAAPVAPATPATPATPKRRGRSKANGGS